MAVKLFFKVSLLMLSLLMVYFAHRYLSSTEFKNSLNDFFSMQPKVYTWCPSHAVDFIWLDESVNEKWKKASISDLESKFCKVTLQPILDADLSLIQFKPLLKVQSAEAKVAELEWNAEKSIFRVNGLPFSSITLSREILDK